MNIVSFGGGTNSTAMIIGMYLRKIPIDLILFADTGGEQPHTYEFISLSRSSVAGWNSTGFRKSPPCSTTIRMETA